MYNFIEVDINSLDVNEYNNFSDKLIYQTKEWVGFVAKTQNAKPIILRIIDDNDNLIGYYTCLLFSKFGFKIIGSPFRGWTTLYMGFNVVEVGYLTTLYSGICLRQ